MKNLPGWFFYPDAVAFSLILGIQSKIGLKGNFGELGVFCGKSTAFLSLFATEGETVFGIDCFPEDTRAKAMEAAEKYGNPTAIDLQTIDIYEEGLPSGMFGGARFTHVDAGHGYGQAKHDITFCSGETVEPGVLVIDDVFNADYPGVQEATHAFLLSDDVGKNKRIFCATGNKVYITEESYADRYINTMRGVLRHIKAEHFVEKGAKGDRLVMFPRINPQKTYSISELFAE